MKFNLYKNLKPNFHKYLGLVIVFLLFSYSVPLRLPLLGRSLGDNHEWILAQSLISLENLNNYPLSSHLFRLVITYPKTENFHVTQWTIMRQIDNKGIGYYTTYPPFAVIWAYIITKLFSLEVSVLNLQIINLVMHGISTLFLYLTVFALTTKKRVLSALTGSAIYIFATPNLWFYSATYSWDTVWHYFSIVNLYILSRILAISNESKKIPGLVIVFGIINAAIIYTEFQGLFFAFSILIALYTFHPKYKKPLTISIFISSAIALGVALTQTSLINGFGKYSQIMMTKFFVEYGSFGNTWITWSLSKLWGVYDDLVIPSLQFLVCSFLVILFSKQSFRLLTRNQTFIIIIITLTSLLHYSLMIPDLVIHEFSSLKFIILISFLTAFFISNIHITSLKMNLALGLITIIGLYSFITKSITTYERLYGEVQDKYQNLATEINTTLANGEVLFFISENVIPPQVTYYTKRNFFTVKNSNEAIDLLDKIGQQKGKVYSVDKKRKITSIETIQVD